MPFMYRLFEKYIEWIGNTLEIVHIRFTGVRLGPFEFELKQKASSYQETIDKIEQTRQHLQEAISAVDGLKSEIQTRKKELDSLLNSVRTTEGQKKILEEEREVSQRLLVEDKKKLKDVLNFYESRPDKLLGFIGGVIASLVAAGIWALVAYFIKK